MQVEQWMGTEIHVGGQHARVQEGNEMLGGVWIWVNLYQFVLLTLSQEEAHFVILKSVLGMWMIQIQIHCKYQLVICSSQF